MTPSCYSEFWVAVTRNGRLYCAFANLLIENASGDYTVSPACDGPLDACHIPVPKQKLKRDLGEDHPAVWDPRNGEPGCRLHHGLVDSGRLAVPRSALRPQAIEFAHEYGYDWLLELRHR